VFGDRLKILREKQGLSQKDMAAALGMGTSTITKYERHERQPDFETLIKIADFFQVSTDILLDRYKEGSKEEAITQIITMIYALDKELQTSKTLPETILIYKDYKTQIDRLFLDLLSYRVSD